ncbi:hypoxanthine phosphoribosyltransferase [Pararhodonellum marinum]|uniref:hypoxanthine phosphoribosyltransferase n=1 Tax=Pararhodonellum marinum TaxID=2755358 RepID=UPI00188FD0D7|nr:hypoxanthine phosphoribosyltransferase [Pararhodonellum marinum]
MIIIKDKQFVPYLSAKALDKRIKQLGKQISEDYKGRRPILIGILNGSFMFCSDLVKEIDLNTIISFVKFSSYQSTASSGTVKDLIGLEYPIIGEDIILIEDIIDTGLTMQHMLKVVKEKKPKSIAIASLLLKPEALRIPVEIKYLGFEIPNKFVVGYGLDYDGLGRNLKEIYQLK